MTLMLIGAIAMGSIAIGVFFLRSWKKTGDRLFLFFSASFFLEGLNRFVSGLSDKPDEASPFFYVVRFVSFLLILIGIAGKNWFRAPRVKTRR